MRIHWRQGILVRWLIFLFASFFLTGVIAIVTTTYVVSQRQHREAIERLDRLIATIDSSARVACFAKDTHIAEDIAKGLLNNKDVRAVLIEALDDDAHLIKLAGERTQSEGAFHLVRDIRSPFVANAIIGRITLDGDTTVIENGIRAEIRFIVMLIVGQLIVIAGIIAAVMLYYIIRPIKAMSDGLHVMDPIQGERLPCPESHAETELGRLVDDINSLAANLVQSVEDERTLREEYRAIFDNAETGIFIVDPEGWLTSWNPSFARLMGLPTFDQCTRLPHTRELAWADPTRIVDLTRQCRAGQLARAEDIALAGDDSNRRWVNVILTEIGDNLIQGVMHDITDHKSAEDEARLKAVTDPLTGMKNRLGMEENLRTLLARPDARFALVMLDLDGFRRVNEGYGLPAGDTLLKSITSRLRQDIKSSDCLARLGADRFVIILMGVDQTNRLESIARRLLDAVRLPFQIEGMPIEVHASLGITLYPRDGVETAELLRNAELALDQAKTDGGDRARLYDDDLGAAAEQRLRWENDLRRAIRVGEFEIHYQPIIDLNAGRVAGAEALIRWYHADRGLVMPDHFIPLAEETGLINDIGLWALDRVCAQLAEWRRKGINRHISLNVSGRQIPDGLTPEHIVEALACHGVEASSLAVEITEGILMADIARAQAWLDAVGALGCGIYLDDFGTGYSSLSYLKRFPVNTLKIDKSFVRDMSHDSNDRTLVEAIVAMARSLSMDVVAEGVENREQLVMLRQIGCRYAQGYYFARPWPIEDLDHIDARVVELLADELVENAATS